MGVVDRFIEQTHGVIGHGVVDDAPGQGFDEGFFDLVVSDVGRGATVSFLVFVVAAPDMVAAFASGVPNFPSKPAAAVGALDAVGERVAVGGSPACAACNPCLNGVPGSGIDDGFVVTGYVVLRTSPSLTFMVLVRKSVVKLFCNSASPLYFSLTRIDRTVEGGHTVLSRGVAIPSAVSSRVSDSLCAGVWFTSSLRIGLGMPRLVG